jgi:hypothetical protein
MNLTNCRWATELEQANNTRSTLRVNAAAEGPLAFIRKRLGISQRLAALMIGERPDSWNNWESKGMSARISLAQHRTIERVFGFRLSDLLEEFKVRKPVPRSS